MVKRRTQLVPNIRYTGGYGNPRTYLTIHQTDNWSRGANAAAHANLQSRNGLVNTSWHWTVDDREAVQSFSHRVKCWHAGTRAGNNNSIGVESCVNSDGDYWKTFENTAQLAAWILRVEGIPLSRMVQHNYWSGKNCPSVMRNNGQWSRFRNRVSQILNGKGGSVSAKTAEKSGNLAVDGYWGPATTRALQRAYSTPVDGVVSSQPAANRGILGGVSGWQFVGSGATGSTVIKALQGELKVTQDGFFGPASIRALQRKYGTTVDGFISNGGSSVVKALQRDFGKRKAGGSVSKPASKPSSKPAVKKPALLKVDGYWGPATTRALQRINKTPVDGIVSSQPAANKRLLGGVSGWQFVNSGATGSTLVRAMQRAFKVTQDGFFGPASIRGMQRYYGTTVDGFISSGGSSVVKAMQRAINRQLS